jgi:RNA polymerase sigma-70 factor, ECF subfamily
MAADDRSADVTSLLHAWRDGHPAALDQLMPVVYAELRTLAHRRMLGERPDHTLQTSALVNEAYLRLLDANRIDWKNRAHFLAVCATLMRRILVEFARAHGSQKKGGGRGRVQLDEAMVQERHRLEDFLELDEVLAKLAAFDARKARVVELRYFGGLTPDETAEALGVSSDTVFRDWRLAKAWLREQMTR